MNLEPTGIATTVKTTFSRTTSVAITINAPKETIWTLLTTAKGYPSWNSTITSIEGEIVAGGTIKLESTLDPSRTFKLKIKQFDVPNQLSWGDATGTRVYTLRDSPDSNSVILGMVEKISSPLFPLFASKIPPFGRNFEHFVADVKKAAENR